MMMSFSAARKRIDRSGVVPFRLILVVLCSLGLGLTAGAGTAAAAPTASSLPTPTSTTLKAVLTLSTHTAPIGSSVTASAAKSTVPTGDKLTKITLNWGDGSKTVTLASLKAKVSHRYTKVGKFTARLTLTDIHKKTAGATGTVSVTALPGSYSGLTSQNYGLTFYVSSDGKSLQEIVIPTALLTCTPGGAMPSDELTIASTAISSGGSFNGTATQTGVWQGFPAKFSYSFKGAFAALSTQGLQAAGTFKETVTYNNGTAYTCTSNSRSWSATRDTQPVQTTAAPPAGSYSGLTWQNYGLTFYVSSDRKSLQDIVIPTVLLTCAPGDAGPSDELTIASTAIGSGGSFTGTATQTGVWLGFPATFSYTFRGHFHSLSPTGVERAAGTFEETVKYANGVTYTCTSDSRTWSATRDSQPAQTTAPPPAGSYSGLTWQNYGLTFWVSSGGKSLQDVAIPTVLLACSPGDGQPADQLTITSATISSGGSFDGSAKQTGVFEGQPATFKYTFRGNFHSLNSNGVERAAGTFEETVTYTNGTTYTCTSNDRTWSATFS